MIVLMKIPKPISYVEVSFENGYTLFRVGIQHGKLLQQLLELLEKENVIIRSQKELDRFIKTNRSQLL